MTRVVLVLLALHIWTRDLRWLAAWEDTLPVLLALPLVAWLGRPWSLARDADVEWRTVAAGVALLAAGLFTNATLLWALGWTWLLWAWAGPRIEPALRPARRRLLALAVFAFPWVTLDAHAVGFWFRWSGAWCAEHLFALTGVEVERHGTDVVVEGLSISVGAPCAGLNVLQALFVVGGATVYVHLGGRRAFWRFLLMLPPLAWIANTLRICTLSAAALSWGPEFAMGAFHDAGGVFVLAFVFLVGWTVCARAAAVAEAA